MHTTTLMLRGVFAATIVFGVAPPRAAEAAPAPVPKTTLAAYGSEAEMMGALARWRAAAQKLRSERRRASPGLLSESAQLSGISSAQMAPSAAAPMAKSADAPSDAADSITNVQTAGVDEGGIVKLAGSHLVILRRGRLFTVKVGGDALRPVASVDAYAPGSDPGGAWYDELLVSGSTVVVVGYSYARGGTEIGLFDLAADGALAHRATHHLRSFDYYSSRNYASRLVGRKLVFYSPTLLHAWGPEPSEMMPGQRRWQGQATPPAFERILPATRVYRTDDDFDPAAALALHTVTSCDLAAEPMDCESSAVLGPAGRVFYVSRDAVYVWTTAAQRHVAWPGRSAAPRTASAVFRMPLDGTAASAIKTAGVPIDQMSFLEDASGHLNVLVRESGAGESMWGSERTRGAMALLRVPLAAFGSGRDSAQREHYRSLPGPADASVQNRFVDDWLLWGGGAAGRARGDRGDPHGRAWALRFADGGAEAIALQPVHAVERIEAMGPHAVLVGNAGSDLQFSSVRLGPDGARIVDRHVQPGAQQGETRTHGFFHRTTGDDEGVLGLPIVGPGRAGPYGVSAGAQGSASVVYLRQRDLAFSPLGHLEAQARHAGDDGCKASCVDWYGNARPLFIGERVFALLGYELVEATIATDSRRERIEEKRRISFAPRFVWREGRYSPFN